MQKNTRRFAQIVLRGRLAYFLTMAIVLGGCAHPPTEPDIDPGPQGNTVPIAAAGPDFFASLGLTIRLGGTGTDADGDAVTYGWVLDAPEGSVATLDDATSPSPKFTPDLAGKYTGTLTVHDGIDSSVPDAVAITAEDNTTVATIGPAGGEVSSRDGDLTFAVPPGALDAAAEISLTTVPKSQIAVLGPEIEERLRDDEMPVAALIRIGEGDVRDALSLSGSITWKTDTESEGDSTGVGVRESLYFDGEETASLAEQRTEVDLDDGRVVHSGALASDGFVAFTSSVLDLTVVGLPDEIEVGETFTAALIGRWVGAGAGPEEVEVDTDADGAVMSTRPTAPVRVGLVGGAFVTDFGYLCEKAGTGRLVLSATSFLEAAAPPEDGHLTSSVGKTVTCVLGTGGGDGFPLGLHDAPGLNDIESVSAIGRRLGSIDNSRGDAVILSGKEGFQIRGLSDNRVIVDGLVTGSDNPLTRIMAVSRPEPGRATPAAVFGSGTDFGNPINPQGGWLFDYDLATQTFADTPAELPGAYRDTQPAGSMITDEIVAATNFGVDFLQWDGSTWAHTPDTRLSLDRYGFAGSLAIGSVAAAEAYGSLLVTIAYHRGDPGRLFFDDRSDGGPIDMGELGVSPAMIRCAIPVCVSVQARDHSIRVIRWDGETEPMIVGDPIPVGFDPGAVAVYRVTEAVTVAATFTGWTDEKVTLTEFDAAASVLSSTSMDLGALGCRGPRNGDWLANPLDPDDPYLVVACYDSNNYYVTLRSAF